MGILYGSVLSALAFMTGFLVFATYAVVIFKEAGAKNINPHISAISMAVLHLIGNLCTAALSDTLGRKALLITSLLGSACGIFTFAFYCYLRSIGFDVTAFEFVPVISLLFAVFSASTGVVPLMFLSIIEHIPSEVCTDTNQIKLNALKDITNCFCVIYFTDSNHWSNYMCVRLKYCVVCHFKNFPHFDGIDRFTCNNANFCCFMYFWFYFCVFRH